MSSHVGANISFENEPFTFSGSLLQAYHFPHTRQLLLVIGFILALGLLKVIYSWHFCFLRYIPEAIPVLGIGIIFGVVMQHLGVQWRIFEERLFFVAFLPPIIFEAVLHMHKTFFCRNFSTILIFGLLGTFLNVIFIITGFVLLNKTSVFTSEGLTLHPYFIVLASVLLTSIDSVSVISILGDLNVHPSLYFIFLGESVLNDGIILVLFHFVSSVICNLETTEHANRFILLLQGLLVVCVKVIGSCMLGAAFGIVTCLITKYTYKGTVVEPLLVLSACYMAYIIDYSICWPGVFCLLVFSLIQTSYTFLNISIKSRITIKRFAHMTASISESLIYLTIGYSLFAHKPDWYTHFNFISVALCLVSRFAIVYALAWLADYVHSTSTPIPKAMKFSLAFCGFRGVLGHSLSEVLNPHCLNKINIPSKLMQTTSVFVTFFTVFTMGTMMKPLLKLFRMRTRKHAVNGLFMAMSEKVVSLVKSGVDDIINATEGNRLTRKIMYWEHRYLRAFLIRDNITHDHFANMFDKIVHKELYPLSRASSTKTDHHTLTRTRSRQLHWRFSMTQIPQFRVPTMSAVHSDYQSGQPSHHVGGITSQFWHQSIAHALPSDLHLNRTSLLHPSIWERHLRHGGERILANMNTKAPDSRRPVLPSTLIVEENSQSSEDDISEGEDEESRLDSQSMRPSISSSVTNASWRRNCYGRLRVFRGSRETDGQFQKPNSLNRLFNAIKQRRTAIRHLPFIRSSTSTTRTYSPSSTTENFCIRFTLRGSQLEPQSPPTLASPVKPSRTAPITWKRAPCPISEDPEVQSRKSFRLNR